MALVQMTIAVPELKMMNRTLMSVLALTLLLFGSSIAKEPDSPDTELTKLVADYTRLYEQATLPEWRRLFDESATVASLKSDGSINIRGLNTFYTAQDDYFATGHRISERLENVSIMPGNRMARVTADFIFRDEEEERHGILGLHVLLEGPAWKIVGIVFSYD